MSTKVVVELTPDEEKVLNAFRRVQASDEKTRAGLKLTGEAGEKAGKQLTDSFIKGGRDSTKSVTRLIAEMKRSGEVGKSVGGSLDKYLSDIGAGGKRSIETIIASIERLQPEVAEKAKAMVAEFRRADQESKFEATRQELESLGGYFETLAGEIKTATAVPMESATKKATELVAQLREIDPSQAEAIATAMDRARAATREAEFDRLVSQMQAGTSEAKQLAAAIDTEVKTAAFEAAGGFESMVAQAKKMRPEMAAFIDEFVADWKAAEQQTQLTTLRSELKSLGGDFEILGTQIDKAFAIPMEQANKRAREIVQELMQIDPAKAQAMANALDQAAANIESAKVDELVRSLSDGNEESRKLADTLGAGMNAASLEAAGGVDAIADKIIALRPELASFVNQWRTEMADAAKFGEGQYAKVLDALRAGGPVSKKVAEQIKRNLVDAGKVGEKSFDDLIAPLQKLDPAMASEAKKMHKHFTDMEKKGKGSFSSIANVAKSELSQIVLAYVGVQEAIQFVTDAIEEQKKVLDDSEKAHRSLARSQQEAYKNLAGFDDKTQDILIQKFAFEVADKAKVPDINAIVDAIGSTASAGANFEQLKSSVEVATLLNRLTPEKIAQTSGSLFDFSRATGNNNAAENASQMFLLASQSRVTDPSKVFKNAAPVLVAGSNLAPAGQEQQVATTMGAIFAAVTKAGADIQGDASATNVIQLTTRMNEFFQGLGTDATKAKAELAKLKKQDPLSNAQRSELNRLSSNEAGSNRTNAVLKRLTAAIDKEQSFQDNRDSTTSKEELRQSAIRERKLREQRAGIKQAQFTDADKARLADLRARIGKSDQDYQKKVAELEGRIAGSKIKGFKGKIPQTPEQQLKAMVASKKLQDAFLADKFGEQRFRPGNEQLIRGGQAYRDTLNTQKLLRDNLGKTDLFDRSVQQSRNRTPQMELDFAASAAETGKMIRDSTDTLAASLDSVRDTIASALLETRSAGVTGFGQKLNEIGISSGRLRGGNFASELIGGVQLLEQRRGVFSADGVQPSEQKRVDRLDAAIESLVLMMGSSAVRELGADQVQFLKEKASTIDRFLESSPNFDYQRNTFDRMIAILERQEEFLARNANASERTEENTRSRRPGVADGQRDTSRQPVGGRRP